LFGEATLTHPAQVWMMGVWSLGAYGLKFDQSAAQVAHYQQVLANFQLADVIGSPYAVCNYSVNGAVGDLAALQRLKKRLNGMGLRLMLDFVPNHSAVDADWLLAGQLDLYVRAPKSQPAPYDGSRFLPNGVAFGWGGWGGAWQDTAQLNFWNPAMVAAHTAQLLKVAAVADAVRCDMAFLALNDQFGNNWGAEVGSWGYTRPAQEFWQVAIGAVKRQYPDVVFLAEVYDPLQWNLQQVGFDYTYDKYLLDQLAAGNVAGARSHIGLASFQYTSHSAHFLSNHDEPRAVAKFGGNWWQANAAALIAYTLPGMRFLWEGDLHGHLNQIAVQLRRETPSADISNVTDFYKTLLPIVAHPVFRDGNWTFVNNNNANLIVYRWHLGAERRLCVLNFTPQQQWDTIVLPDAAPSPVTGDSIPVTDLLTNTTWTRSGARIADHWFGGRGFAWRRSVEQHCEPQCV
jgi:glycosidase